MASLHTGVFPDASLADMFLGKIGGSLGEVSAAALLLGGAYLIFRKVISPRIPVSYLATVAILTLVFPRGGDAVTWMLYNLFGGGLMLGAIFMATDYATSPSPRGPIFSASDAVSHRIIRYFGSTPKGVSNAISS
jgi:electron transport complex protein RnfD